MMVATLGSTLIISGVATLAAYVFAALYNIATIGSFVFVMLVWALVTDCIDYTEYKTGKKIEGTLDVHGYDADHDTPFGSLIFL